MKNRVAVRRVAAVEVRRKVIVHHVREEGKEVAVNFTNGSQSTVIDTKESATVKSEQWSFLC
jgi:hypothetical protein